MATRNRAIVATQWKADGSSSEPAILTDLPPGVSVTDITGQQNTIVPPTPNIYLVEVAGLTNAQLATLNGLPAYVVLMSEQYDDGTGVVSASTYDDKPTAGQLTTFANTLKTRFPNVDDDKLTDAGRAAFRAGLTRREIVTELTRRWRKFQKGS